MSADTAYNLALNRRDILLSGATLAVTCTLGVGARAQQPSGVPPIAPSPGWTRVLPPGPDARTKITEEYAKQVARDTYFWAWPLVNMYNRRLAFQQVKDFIFAGPVPSAPLNKLAMLTDYIAPEQRHVACPNQDVVYGAGFVGLDVSPVVIQVPDFGTVFGSIRSWMRGPTVLPRSERCTAPPPASTC
jgi:Protein of unknown function (DUF1254)